MESPNGGELCFHPRSVKPPPTANYSLAFANDVVPRIAPYYDLDIRPLVSTPMVPIPSKPRKAISSFGGSPSLGESAAMDAAPPEITRGGF